MTEFSPEALEIKEPSEATNNFLEDAKDKLDQVNDMRNDAINGLPEGAAGANQVEPVNESLASEINNRFGNMDDASGVKNSIQAVAETSVRERQTLENQSSEGPNAYGEDSNAVSDNEAAKAASAIAAEHLANKVNLLSDPDPAVQAKQIKIANLIEEIRIDDTSDFAKKYFSGDSTESFDPNNMEGKYLQDFLKEFNDKLDALNETLKGGEKITAEEAQSFLEDVKKCMDLDNEAINNFAERAGFSDPVKKLIQGFKEKGFDIKVNTGSPEGIRIDIEGQGGEKTYLEQNADGDLQETNGDGEPVPEGEGNPDAQNLAEEVNKKNKGILDRIKSAGSKAVEWLSKTFAKIWKLHLLGAVLGISAWVLTNWLAHNNRECRWNGLKLNNISSKLPFVGYLVNDQYGTEDIKKAQDKYYNPFRPFQMDTLGDGGPNENVSYCNCNVSSGSEGVKQNVNNEISRAYSWWFGVDDTINSADFPSQAGNAGNWNKDFTLWFNATVNVVDPNNGVNFPTGTDTRANMKTILSNIATAIQNNKIFSQSKYNDKYQNTIKYVSDNPNQLGAIAAIITEYIATIAKDNNTPTPTGLSPANRHPNLWKLVGADGGTIINKWQYKMCENGYGEAYGAWSNNGSAKNPDNRVIPACLRGAKDNNLGPNDNKGQGLSNEILDKDILQAPGPSLTAYTCFDINVGQAVSGGYYDFQQYGLGDLLGSILNPIGSIFNKIGDIIKLIIIIVACIIGGSIVIWAFVKYAMPQIKKAIASAKEGSGNSGGGDLGGEYGFNMGRRRNPYMMLK